MSLERIVLYMVPSYLFGVGLKRAGAQRFAIIGTVGPVATLLLARFLLHEAIHPLQLVGFGLSLAGGLAVALMKSAGSKPPPAPEVVARPTLAPATRWAPR